MDGMENAAVLEFVPEVAEGPLESQSEVLRESRRRCLGRFAGRLARGVCWVAEGVFGAISLVLGLSILAAFPVVQFLSLGYFLESSARVARSGRLRDGVIGVRPAARVGGLVTGSALSLLP